MSQEESRVRMGRQLTVHGSRGFDVAALLERHGIRLSPEDLLVIAEYDDPVASWLELEDAPLLAA